ncbi:MAG TPA: sigma-70 family RNA polymerase sigma factor [Longimicrobiaceae bacterium]|nr:sigma-70 family RNA polymerase sigma factor [Longimicrobiaceae bacterium]
MDDDARLVERAQRGDAAAFETLVRRHLRGAYTVALAVTGDPADAEDVSQEALMVALERLEQCSRPELFAGWLFRIVRTRALNFRRAQAVRAASPLDAAAAVASADSPERDMERALLRERLLEGLAALTPVQREVVLLHDLEGWRHREIAESLGMAEGTARHHLFHARRTLRSLLGASPNEVA